MLTLTFPMIKIEERYRFKFDIDFYNRNDAVSNPICSKKEVALPELDCLGHISCPVEVWLC